MTGDYLSDPAGGGAIGAAVGWLQGTLLGTVAVSVAVIAVATVGLMMLGGRIDLRRGVGVILGCFVLFGARSIAAGLQAAVAGAGGALPVAEVSDAPPPLEIPEALATPQAYDPYAGASVPRR